MDCSPPGSSVHGISQARILERVAIPFSRGSLCLVKMVLRSIKMRGQNIDCGRKSLAVSFPDFHSSTIFQKEGDINLDQKCHVA